ncbi:MAG: glycosyltransferase family 61 protein, partial [Alphaproteobacteria bacterium]|nr:glycosyltransferase family 61 protein [Alphaproteobacteria bacterium]
RGLDYRIIAPASQVDLRTDSSAYPHLHYALPETFAIRLTDVTLIPTHFSVVTSDHAVLLDGLHYGGRLDRFVTNYFAYVSADNRVLALLPNKAQIHDEPAVLLGGDLNFAHCLLDSFSRLSVIEAMPELASRRLVVSTSMRPSVAEALKLMGWDDQKLIRVDPAECHRFRDLWVPSFTHAMFRRPAPVHLAFLRRRLFSQAEQRDPRTARRRFLLSRGGAPHRRALNEDEIMTALAPLGFERISTETMTMAQRIELLAQAEVVVGLAGAGMANVVALPRSTVVIEVTHQHWVEQHFLALSRMLDHLHRFVVGRAAVKPGVPLQHCDYTVESGRIVNAVNDLMKDRRARLSSWRPLAPND